MAGTVTFTNADVIGGRNRSMRKVTIAWTSDASGDATGTSPKFGGTIERVAFVPGSGGSQPTTLYDVVINDENSLDVLAGQGANLSNVTSTSTCPGVALKDGTTTSVKPMVVYGTLSLVVSNGGNAKSGTIVLYVS